MNRDILSNEISLLTQRRSGIFDENFPKCHVFLDETSLGTWQCKLEHLSHKKFHLNTTKTEKELCKILL